ncbi:MAG TPA: hydroxymethylbilane synthase [Tepidisphaeraceae bacterium]|jgi:hydroxymethylbilane synthase
MTAPANTIRLGTRGSLLAKTQSQLIASAIEKLNPDVAVELVIFKTQGDLITHKPLHEFGGKGLFTQELERALLDGSIDFAVHSFKDVPVTMPLVDQTDLFFPSVPEREDPRDVMVSLKAKTINELPEGAKVGTGSLRRRSQLLATRPDLKIELIRGNIDTRLRKLREGQFDAVILAAAGLRRTGLFDEAEMVMLSTDEMLPAPGQGALALQCRRDNQRIIDLLASVNDPESQKCVVAERAIVQALKGDCHSPIAALAELSNHQITLRVAVGGRDGNPPVLRAAAIAGVGNEPDAVASAMQALTAQGVREILAGNPAASR